MSVSLEIPVGSDQRENLPRKRCAAARRKPLKYFTLMLFVCLSLGLTQAQAADYYVETVDDAVVVHVKPGDTGLDVDPEKVEFTDRFMELIDLANAGQAYFTVVVSNDSTVWKELEVMRDDPRFKHLDFDEMNRNYNSLSQGGRQTAADMILSHAGLKLHAKVNWRFLEDKTCYFKIFGVEDGDQDEKPELIALSIDDDISPLAMPVPYAPQIKFTISGGTPPYQAQVSFDQEKIFEDSTDTIDITHMVEKVGDHEIELMVVDAVQDTLVFTKGIRGLKSNWALGLHGGVSSTRKTVAPSATASLYWREQVMVRGHFVHGLFLRQDRDYFGSDEPSFDRAWGLVAGYKLSDVPIWLTLGWHHEESILDATDEAGGNLSWYDLGEFGINYIHKNIVLILAGTYGHEKPYNENLNTTFGVRFAVVVGNTWGW